MTLEEKAGLMVGPTLPMGPGGTVNEESRPMANPFGGRAWSQPGTSDAALVEGFARIAAEEYVSVGIRGAYHPQINLATEPRWGRISGTLGEDADLTCAMTGALVRGFQGRELGPKSVALVVKHFPGGGPADDGHDSHFAYGKFDVYPGGNFDYHVRPFKAAIDAVRAQQEDVPYDSKDPLFPFGHGLTYPRAAPRRQARRPTSCA